MAKLSLSEVSNRFNVSRSTLYRAIKEGRIDEKSLEEKKTNIER